MCASYGSLAITCECVRVVVAWLLLVNACEFPVRICVWNFLGRAFHTSPHFLEDNSKTALPNGTRLLPYHHSQITLAFMFGHFVKRLLLRPHSQQNCTVMKAREDVQTFKGAVHQQGQFGILRHFK